MEEITDDEDVMPKRKRDTEETRKTPDDNTMHPDNSSNNCKTSENKKK